MSSIRASIGRGIEISSGIDGSGDVAPEAVAALEMGNQELEFAELETRLRIAIVEMMQPTINKASAIEGQMEELRSELAKSASMLSQLAHANVRVEQQVSIIEVFREEMTLWDSERRDVQAQVAQSLANLRMDLDVFRADLDRKDSTITGVERTLGRSVGELKRVQDLTDELRKQMDARLTAMRQVLNGSKADLETKLVDHGMQLNRLSDEVWGGETGLKQVMNDLRKTNDMVQELQQKSGEMQIQKANVVALELMQEEVNELLHQANNSIATLQSNMGTVVEDVKSHFMTATTTVSHHNASMVSEVRSSYQKELSQAVTTRADTVKFMEETKTNNTRIEEVMQISQDLMQTRLAEMREEIQERARSQSKDKSNADLTAKTLRQQLANVNESSEAVAKWLEHICSTMWTMLQSEAAASALEMQDGRDRQRVALMGYPDPKEEERAQAKGRPDSSASTRPCTAMSMAAPGSRPGTRLGTREGRRQSKARSATPVKGEGAEDQESAGPVISVDNRCMSCSGHSQTVLSGFKMACLQYMPGPVTFCNKTHSRMALLEMRQKLIDQAVDGLKNGPINFAQKEATFEIDALALAQSKSKDTVEQTSGSVPFGSQSGTSLQQCASNGLSATAESRPDSRLSGRLSPPELDNVSLYSGRSSSRSLPVSTSLPPLSAR